MSKSDGIFYCFPIGMLSFDPANPAVTLSTIIDLSVNRMAQRAYGNMALQELKRLAQRSDAYRNALVRPRGESQYRLLLAAEALGTTYNCGFNTFQVNIHKAAAHLEKLSPAAQNNTVQIKTQFLWSCLNTVRGEKTERSLSWREFRVLCAVLSKIGAKGVRKCAWLEIQARAASFCGKRDLKKALENAPESRRKAIQESLLTRSQIRTTLERLERDRFFARYNHGIKARESWFSFSMTAEKLRAHVLCKKQRSTMIAERRKADRGALRTINEKIANINSKIPSANAKTGIANINTDSGKMTSPPPMDRQGTSQPVANINKNNLNKNNLNKNDSNEHTPASPAHFFFTPQEQEKWPEFIKREGFEGYPISGCGSLHYKFFQSLKAHPYRDGEGSAGK